MTDNCCRDRSVAVIGGGIGGLVAALCFAARGAAVTIYEQAPEFSEVGAGIQIAPNGARVLEALDLLGALDKVSVRAEAVEPVDGLTGRALTRFDLSALEGPGYRFVHRADLLNVLLDAARVRGVTLVTDARVEDVGEDGRFTARGAALAPDLTIGADGLHSVARGVLNGADRPFFTGQVAWRAVIGLADAPPVARVWMAPGRHLVTYPLTGGRLNIVAVQERSEWADEGWHNVADPGVLRAAFARLSGRVTGLLERVEDVREWGLFRHLVAARWYGEKLAILGDAAHPTLPFLAQGASLAMEDAWLLAARVDGLPLKEALHAYQSARAPRVARAIEAASANGRNYHLSGMQRTASHAALRAMGKVVPGLWLGRLDWLYGYDVTAA